MSSDRAARAVRRLWLASAFSAGSTWTMQIALFVAVLREHGVATLAVVELAGTAPALLVMPLAGALADRFDPRRLTITSMAVQAVCVAGLAALLGGGALWAVTALYAAQGVADTVWAPARQLWLHRQVEPAGVARANAALGSISGLTIIAGATLGGVLSAWGPAYAMAVATLLQIAAAVPLLLLARLPAAPAGPGTPADPGIPADPGAPLDPAPPADPGQPADPAPPAYPGQPADPGPRADPGAPADTGAPAVPGRSGLRRQLADGLGAVRDHRLAASVVWIGIAWGCIGGAYSVLLAGHALTDLHLSSAVLGVLYAVDGAAVIAGTVVAARLAPRRHLPAYAGAYLVQGAAWALFFAAGDVVLATAALAVMRLSSGVIIALDTTILLATVPERLRGRVTGLHITTYSATARASLALYGVLLTVADTRLLGAGSGVVSMAIGLVWWWTQRRDSPRAYLSAVS
ncbi:MFS transporter [Actinoplanes philippinensis]|uniref:MFS transporter n=1 Tax=Actinoplanes philippinensis TaxID=35752 RepID=UPI0033F9A501